MWKASGASAIVFSLTLLAGRLAANSICTSECNSAAMLVLPAMAVVIGLPGWFLVSVLVIEPSARFFERNSVWGMKTALLLAPALSLVPSLLTPATLATSTPWTWASYLGWSYATFTGIVLPSCLAAMAFYLVRRAVGQPNQSLKSQTPDGAA